MTLTQLSQGSTAVIKKISSPRLAEWGLTRGTIITVLGKGPFGDPLCIEAGGCRLLIDRRLARKAEVEPCGCT